ncbi:MAG: DUF748 domain-containing protein [Candidatus Omnitrophota bacterium]
MKILAKIIIVILIVFLGICVAAYIFINTKGKDLVISQLENTLQPKVDIESMKLIFPATIQLQRIDIEGFLTAEELIIQPSLLTLLSGNIGFSKIVLVEPDVTINRNSDGSFNVTSLLKPKSGKSRPVVIGELQVKNGVIKFVDRKVEYGGFTTKITDLNMRVRSLINPSFKISAEIQGRESSGLIRANGRVNLLRKDMDAEFELSDLDGAYFGPYFKKFLSDKKLKTANVNSQVSLTAKNNVVDGKCSLEISNIAYEEPKEGASEEEEKGFPSPLAIIFGSGGNLPEQISIDLPIKGTLIPFKIDLAKISGSIFTEMLKKAIVKDPKKIPERVEDIGDQFKAFGKEIEKVFKKE